MFINSHAHIFNARSLLNKYTLEILINRINEQIRLDETVKALIVKELRKVVNQAGEYVDEEVFYRSVVDSLWESKKFTKWTDGLLPEEIGKLEFVGKDFVKEAAADQLVEMLIRVNDRLMYGKDSQDAETQNTADFFAFLKILFQPSIRSVADRVMKQLPGKQDILVALSLDITGDGKDKGQYVQQLKDTSEVALAYPGRVLPFVSVNTNRPDHFRIMERALTAQGFVGVKLYPSLGYAIDSPEMMNVYAYCETDQIPVLMHCNKGGFRYSKECANYSSPKKWKKILKRHPNLKICFGHFGGDRFMSGLPENPKNPKTCDKEPWTPLILELMESYENVYADISFHTAQMDQVVEVKDANGNTKSVPVEKTYFKTLTNYLKHPIYKHRILWGSDYFLVRQRLKESSQWKYFRKHLHPDHFKLMATTNSSRFLNLPDGNSEASEVDWNIDNYMEFIVRNNSSVQEDLIPPWLNKLIRSKYGSTIQFHGSALGIVWTINNMTHKTLYQCLKERKQLGKPAPAFSDAGSWLIGELLMCRQISGISSSTMKLQRRRLFANQIMKDFKDAGFHPRKKNNKALTKKVIQAALVQAFKDEKKKLADLAGTLDGLYEIKA